MVSLSGIVNCAVESCVKHSSFPLASQITAYLMFAIDPPVTTQDGAVQVQRNSDVEAQSSPDDLFT
jgi:hypothetical protein